MHVTCGICVNQLLSVSLWSTVGCQWLSQIILGFLTVKGVSAPTPMLFKGQWYDTQKYEKIIVFTVVAQCLGHLGGSVRLKGRTKDQGKGRQKF